MTTIPHSLRDRRQWLVWRLEQQPGDKKPRKVPYYTSGRRRAGEQGSDEDRAALVDFGTAEAARPAGRYTGLGFAFLPGDGLIGIDLDGMIDAETGEICERGRAIIEACASYTELSPSGRGVHIIVAGETETFKSNAVGIEVFCGRQFFTFTGRHYPGTPAEVMPISGEALRRLRLTVEAARAPANVDAADILIAPSVAAPGDGLVAKVESALAYVSADCGYDEWLHVGMAIHAELGDLGFAVWDAWSSKSAKYPGEREMRTKWKSFQPGPITGGTLYGMASRAGWRAPRPVDTQGATRPEKSTAPNAVPRQGNAAASASSRPNYLDPLTPPTMAVEGYPPLLKAIVDTACESSEAHPVAVAANVIAIFSCMIGRGPFQWIGDNVLHARPNTLIVGKSGKARKGTSMETPLRIGRTADEMLRQRLKVANRLRIHAGGLSTGEGIVYAIRDADEEKEDAGVSDKRLLVVEPEFDNVLSHVKREGNTLSAMLRNLWDGRDAEPMSKSGQKSGERATRPHVVVIGHITGFELREKSSENDAANGLLNRFLTLYVHRPKLVPLPEPTPEARINHLSGRLADAIEAATVRDFRANNRTEIRLGDEAKDLWVEEYPQLSRDRDGKGGSLMARAEVYARMLAMIFCLLDCRREIEPCDLRAALAWIDYWRQSVDYIFRMGDEEGELDPFTLQVFEAIRGRPGITATELSGVFHRNKSAKEIRTALEVLVGMAPPLVEAKKRPPEGGRAGAGRVATQYYPSNAGQPINERSAI